MEMCGLLQGGRGRVSKEVLRGWIGLAQTAQNRNQVTVERENNTPKKPWNKTKIAVTAVVCLLVALGGFAIYFFSSDLPAQTFTAATVGGHKLTAAQYSYYFSVAYNDFLLENGDKLSAYGLDTSKTLAEQKISDEMTWEDYFKAKAMTNIVSTYATYDEAVKNGVTLSEEDQKSIDLYLASIESNAKANNARLSSYLYAQFGKGVTLDVVRGEVERQRLSRKYQQRLTESYTFTETQMLDEYNKNKDSLDMITYYSFFVPIDNAGDPTQSAQEERQKAEEMCAAVTDAQSFAALAREYAQDGEKETYADDNATRKVEYLDKLTVSAAKTWLKDASRLPGDKTVLDGLDGYYVMYYENRERPETKTVNVRQILITPEGSVSEETGMTQGQKDAVLQKAEEILKEYQSGEQTEASFGALAAKYSADTGTASSGGLYENIYQYQQSKNLNDWCFDASRKPGDTGIILSDKGAHLLYFVMDGEPMWRIQVRTSLTAVKIAAYQEELYAKYPYEENAFGMGYFVSI